MASLTGDRDAAAKSAARRNAARAKQAPLLAWADVLPLETTDSELERRIHALTASTWRTLARAEDDAQSHALIAYLRYEMETLVGVDEVERAARWADSPNKPLLARRSGWVSAHARVLAGEDPVPDVGYLRPSACWASHRAALDGLDGMASGDAWRASTAEHDAAGCRREWCEIAKVPAPEPVFLGAV